MSTATATATTSAVDLITSLQNRLIKIRNDLMAETAQAMSDAMQDGQDFARERIELSTTKTGDERAARGGGVPGRVDTGDYEDDYTHQAYQIDPNHQQGRFGWLDGGVEAHQAGGKSYIELQEDGFVSPGGTDNPGGTEVAPVHALMDAAEVTKGVFKKRLTDYVNEVLS